MKINKNRATSLFLDGTYHRILKIEAAEKGISLTELLNSIIRRHIEEVQAATNSQNQNHRNQATGSNGDGFISA